MPNGEQEKGRTDMEQRLPFRKTKIADFLKRELFTPKE